ncbi:MAG: hypothetical protein ACRD16_05790 [Thermoanaerobaculia bacterium]
MAGARVKTSLLAAIFLLVLRPAGAQQIRVGLSAATPLESPRAPGKDGPIVEIRSAWPVMKESLAIPPEPVAVLLALEFPDSVPELADPDLDRFVGALQEHPNITLVSLGTLAPGSGQQRWAYIAKRVASAARGARPAMKIALAAETASPETAALLGALAGDSEAAPYFDAFLLDGTATALAPVLAADAPGDEIWCAVGHPADSAGEAADRLLASFSEIPSAAVLLAKTADPTALFAVEARIQRYLGEDVSREPRPALARLPDGKQVPVAAFFRAKDLSPIRFLRAGAATEALELAAGNVETARVENLSTGARRSFEIAPDSKALALDTSRGPLAVELVASKPRSGETRSQVTVGAPRSLTAEEIVAKERAWKAAQDELVKSYTADLTTSLRFRVAEVNETFDLTIRGPLFKRRGNDFDWAWSEFYVNGIRWKGKTLPKIPILQPEKVTTLPLEIELSEDYAYSLAGTTAVDGRTAYEVDFAPKSGVGEKPLYKGRVWIDVQTFALLRRRSVQQNLKGETLSNVETEYYRPVPGTSGAVLPLEIKGEEVFSTAGRTTAVERAVVMKHVRINPENFDVERTKTYASSQQMVRDTERGLKYLIPDAAHPGARVVEEYVSKKSLFGAAGAFYDGSLSYPVPLLGVQYFNFDLFKTGKQISTFFAGAVLTTNYTDPAFLGSRFDLGADVFAFAIPFGDASYRNGKEVKSERLKHVPAVFQINAGHPLGPYVKASLGVFAKWDDYQRDPDTAGDFVTPADTFTFGEELKITANINGFAGTLDYSRFHRDDWPFWGIPGQSEYNPSQRDYQKWSAQISKDYYFSGFRKIHGALTYLSGSDLDRFSRYEFGAFSGNPLRGYQSGALRTKQAWIMNLSYGLNIENIIRLEGLYDQAIVNDPVSGFRHRYYSGVGVSGQLNGPWSNSLIRFDVGVPAVSHGIRGVSGSMLLLKLF